MSATSGPYWQSLGERRGERGPGDEFDGPPPVVLGQRLESKEPVTRRGFLQALGLSAAALGAACNRAPVQKIIPFLIKPEEITPGVPLWYASTCAACPAQCGVLLKTRDGRPIKVEGNPQHPVSRGGLCATGQASVLSLYDAARARGPLSAGVPTGWAALDARVLAGLSLARERGQPVRVIAPQTLGPTLEAALARFVGSQPGGRVVRWDALGDAAAVADAHLATHGVRTIPSYRLDRARVVASFAADFLGTWISPVVLTRRFAEGRAPSRGEARLRLHVLEPAMSLTGSNADARTAIAPSDLGPALAGLVRRLIDRVGHPAKGELASRIAKWPASAVPGAVLDALADELARAEGGALVLCGSADAGDQALCNAANELLSAYGKTVDLGQGQRLPEDALPFAALLAELESGRVGAVLVLGENPVYGSPQGGALAALLRKVPLSLSTADRLDETAKELQLLAPAHQALEGWADAAPEPRVVALRQPAIRPLFDTRDLAESLLAWAGAPQGAYQLLRARWEREVWPKAAAAGLAFQPFWDAALERGFVTVAAEPPPATFRPAGLPAPRPARPAAEFEVWIHPQIGLRDGALANNGWLQELPDPITKVTWTNVAALSPAAAARLGLADGDLAAVTVNGRQITLPALAQPGVHPRVIAIAAGYGRTAAGPIGDGRGANACSLAAPLIAAAARVARAGPRHALARTQTHASQEGRPLVRELSLEAVLAGEKAAESEEQGSMWSSQSYPGHRWAMAIDLDACTGCSACLVSCQAENNVPVVGEDEVRRRRELHWIRIDRYWTGPEEAPAAVHQPMLCQHCENAPCETVCPVVATVHSSEGLNQQVYNRCIGTRYCANNCPPKVRRFNWFDYPHDEPLARMVLNPDVVVRSRGVMEKCSFCVQRVQEAKERTRRLGTKLLDGDIQAACQQSCPAQAISFGDANDPKSRVAQLAREPRAYRVLEELGIGPSIVYLAKIRSGGGAGGKHG